ncbi:MAG: S9 family peptidase [Bacteroidetes bacterium]|nr:MAG: S9 family peptidase [Bacteroidota bacterium]
MKKSLSLILGLILVFQGFSQKNITSKISLNDIFKSRQFYAKSVRGIASMKDGNHYCQLNARGIVESSYKTGEETRLIVDASKLFLEDSTLIRINSYHFNQDETQVLISTNTEAIYRHSTKADFYIYDLATNTLKALSPNGKQSLATFSPDGSKIAFVRENNLFLVDLEKNTEQQITTDGKIENIINGSTDWVYEEEFSFTKAFFWSPNGKYIAFYRFDESQVKEYELTYYGDLYPRHEKYKYPKAGEDNSVVSIHTYSLTTGEIKSMNIGTETDIYIPRIQWTNSDNALSISRLNRLQNNFELLIADPETGNTETIYTESNKYYVDITDDLHFISGKKEANQGFILTSESEGYKHIYYYNMKGELLKKLTDGSWDVDRILGFDSKRKVVYFNAAKSSAINREVYAVSLKGELNPIEITTGWNSVNFSSNFNYYISNWSDANHVPVYSLKSRKGKLIKTLQENKELAATTQEFGFLQKEFFKLKNSENIELNAYRILPPNFDENKKYPVLFYVYGGPGSQTVQNRWSGSRGAWYQMLAQNDIIIVSVDNRGTGFRGEEFKKMTYLQLGKYEIQDQIEAAKHMAQQPYVDASKIAIFGWSYGGYMSSLAMTKGADVFNTGIAVAPVTNWRYYDNIYTERFMRTPQENADGYDDNSPINHVEKLRGNYLLIHGGADDNVHPQNSFDMVTALVAANKQFDYMAYPNSNHGIYTGKNTSLNLYTKMTNFLFEHLK